jgi:hypothetical protein
LSTALAANTDRVGTIANVTIPASLSSSGYTINSILWKSGQTNH